MLSLNKIIVFVLRRRNEVKSHEKNDQQHGTCGHGPQFLLASQVLFCVLNEMRMKWLTNCSTQQRHGSGYNSIFPLNTFLSYTFTRKDMHHSSLGIAFVFKRLLFLTIEYKAAVLKNVKPHPSSFQKVFDLRLKT